MIELLIMRHGQSVADIEDRHEGRADFPLTELGRAQASLASAWIAANYPPARIIASPLRRAAETAEIVAAACGGVVVQYEPDLMEMDNGVLAGLLR